MSFTRHRTTSAWKLLAAILLLTGCNGCSDHDAPGPQVAEDRYAYESPEEYLVDVFEDYTVEVAAGGTLGVLWFNRPLGVSAVINDWAGIEKAAGLQFDRRRNGAG